MNRLRQSISNNWPAWLVLIFFAVLPLRREMEWPVSILALSLAFLAWSPARRQDIRTAARIILPIFLCIWIPMLISSFDSLDPHKSWRQTIPALRYLAAALAIAVLLRNADIRAMLLRVVCWLLLFWAGDGYFQLIFGFDVFGVPMHEDRLNALFYSRYGAYGPTLAMLSPLALVHMHHHWPRAAWLAGFAFIFGAVLISGMRSAWIMMVVVMAAFMWPMLRDRSSRRLAFALPLVAVLTLIIAVVASPLLQERLKLTSLAAVGTEQAIDEASSYRVPIFRHALSMYRDYPVNGVGVRAFRKAYMNYAEPDDMHFIDGGTSTRAHQAHNIVLEFMADTGTIGLLGLIAAVMFGIRAWCSMAPAAKKQALPFAIALLAIIFPFNSYFALFGVYMMSITWVLIGLFAAAAFAEDSGAAEQGAHIGDGDNHHRDNEEYADNVLGHRL